jgi:photosystem II stability/assembly factor-like uncharacterized protein
MAQAPLTHRPRSITLARLGGVVAAVTLWSLLTAVVGSVALGAPVSVGHSGWTWGDPIPQGQNLNDVVFAGTTGYAVGDFGTVLRSIDGGNSWAGLSSGTRSNLSLVQEVDPNTVIIGGECTVRESVNAGETFQRLPITESERSCHTKIASFSFLNGSVGFVEQSDGSIFATGNGGQTLEPRTAVPLNGASAGKLVFTSPSTGFAITGGNGGGRIYRTTDGANSWTQVGSSPASLSDITFVSPTTAYAVGTNGTLLQSTDEGASWHSLALALPGGVPPPSLTHISCSDQKHCLMSTAAAPQGQTNMLVRTSDGGKTGSVVSASELNLLAVAFSAGSDAVAVGEYGATALSADGGETFPTLISRNLRTGLHGLIRLGESSLDAYAPWPAGQIATTDNAGETWRLLRVPTTANIEDVAFPSVQVGYALNHSGTVFRTGDGGASWSLLTSGGRPAAAMLAPNPETVLLVGPTGVRRSTNGGASFASVDASIALGRRHRKLRKVALSSFNLSRGAELAGGAIFAFGSDVLESTDGGSGWTLLPRPLPRRPVSAISFVSPTTGYEVSDGRLFFTGNRGRRWREILSVNVANVDSIGQLSFSSARDGFVLGELQGEEDVIMHTEDGGATWAPQVIGFPLGSVIAGSSVSYAEGGKVTSLFQTTNGGLSPSASTLSLAIVGKRRVSPRGLRRASNRVRLVGHLSPALEGEPVIVSYFTNGSWHFKGVTVSSTGTFALTVPGIRATTTFIAQWTGDDLVSGAGTPATQLTVTHRVRRHRAR